MGKEIHRLRRGAVALLAAAVLGPTNAQQVPAEIRVWGLATDRDAPDPLLRTVVNLEDGYRRHHPEIRFTHHRSGDDSALGSLAVGAADVAFMQREPSYIELDGYQQVIAGLRPVDLVLTRGGPLLKGHGSPLVVIVNRRNALTQVSLEQLDVLFNAASPRRQRALQTARGLPGIAWPHRRITMYGFPIESAEAQTFRAIAMGGSQRWIAAYNEVGDSSDVVSAVRRDRYAIGLTTLDAVVGDVRILAVGDSKKAATLPTQEAIVSAAYPLVRNVRVLARSTKEGRMEPPVHAFLRYLMGDEAQAIIAASGGYVRLDNQTLAIEQEAVR